MVGGGIRSAVGAAAAVAGYMGCTAHLSRPGEASYSVDPWFLEALLGARHRKSVQECGMVGKRGGE